MEFAIYQVFPAFVMFYLLPRHLREVKPAIVALVVFVSTCGLTHLAELWTIGWAAYRLTTAVHVLNVVTSSIGLTWLVIAIRRIRYVPTRNTLEDNIEHLMLTVKNVKATANQLAKDQGDSVARDFLHRTATMLEERNRTR